MTESDRISVHELRLMFDLLMQHLEGVVGGEIVLDKDFFWSISPDQLYDVYERPSEFSIGQLTECWSFLRGIVDEPESVTSYGLVWLAELLRAIGVSTVR